MAVIGNPKLGAKTLQRFILAQGGTPIRIAPSGTMGANGALTSGTAFALTYSAGIWLYFPAGAVAAGSAAGFYWTVMSNTTAGTVYMNTYTPGTTSFDPPGANTAVVDAGPGAYTGVLTTTTALSLTVPANLLGPHGGLRCDILGAHNNSAGAKVYDITFGGSSVSSNSVTTTTTVGLLVRGRNRGVLNKQVWHPVATTPFGTSGTAVTDAAINTAADATLAITLDLATATDTVGIEQFLIEVSTS